MRWATLASVVMLSVSAAALAQVDSTPVGDKVPGPEATVLDNTGAPSAAATATPNETDPRAPSTALVNSAANVSADPGQRPPR